MQLIVDWLEVWALFIPLIFLCKNKKQPAYLKPVIAYMFLALYLNLLTDISWKGKKHFAFPVWFQVNTYFYSIHSVARFFLFSVFFINLKQPFMTIVKKVFPLLFLAFIIVNYVFFEPLINYWFHQGKLHSIISHRVMAAESVTMLIYCLQYYLYKLLEEPQQVKRPADFWVVTGLSVFSVCSFPIYLFYPYILEHYREFTVNVWLIQKLSFLVFCLFIARAFSISKTTG